MKRDQETWSGRDNGRLTLVVWAGWSCGLKVGTVLLLLVSFVLIWFSLVLEFGAGFPIYFDHEDMVWGISEYYMVDNMTFGDIGLNNVCCCVIIRYFIIMLSSYYYPIIIISLSCYYHIHHHQSIKVTYRILNDNEILLFIMFQWVRFLLCREWNSRIFLKAKSLPLTEANNYRLCFACVLF